MEQLLRTEKIEFDKRESEKHSSKCDGMVDRDHNSSRFRQKQKDMAGKRWPSNGEPRKSFVSTCFGQGWRQRRNRCIIMLDSWPSCSATVAVSSDMRWDDAFSCRSVWLMANSRRHGPWELPAFFLPPGGCRRFPLQIMVPFFRDGFYKLITDPLVNNILLAFSKLSLNGRCGLAIPSALQWIQKVLSKIRALPFPDRASWKVKSELLVFLEWQKFQMRRMAHK